MSSQFILPFPVVSSGDARNPFKGVNFLQAREGPVRRPENIYSIEVMETSTIGTGMKYYIEDMETSTIGVRSLSLNDEKVRSGDRTIYGIEVMETSTIGIICWS